MVFSSTTNKNGIIQMIEQTTNLGDAQISGVAIKLAYFTNLVNQWAQIVHQYIRQVSKEWQFDDLNQTTLPTATTTLVDDQRDYLVPTTLQRVRGVEVLDSAGNYYSLFLMGKDDPALKNEKWQETSGIPSHYYMLGNSVMLYPAPDTAMVTAAAGLRLSFDRKLDLFTVSDTTQEPGFEETYHSILYYGPSYEWASVQGVQHIAQHCLNMLGGFEGLNALIKKHYSDRNEDDPAIITREHKSYA
jgi:hypothetical protein